MPTIQKRGDTYRITVSSGYDAQGKQIRKSTTWKPAPGMTQKQIEKELNKQAVMFEEQCKRGQFGDNTNIIFADFCDQYKDIMKESLSPTTLERKRSTVQIR